MATALYITRGTAFFKAVWDFNPFETKAYWAQVEKYSPSRILGAYRPVIDNPEHHEEHVWNTGALLNNTGHTEEALALRTYLVEHYRRSGTKQNLQAALGNQALILKARGDLDGAMGLLKEQSASPLGWGTRTGCNFHLATRRLILYSPRRPE